MKTTALGCSILLAIGLVQIIPVRALSAAAGAGYAMLKPKGASLWLAGAGFGTAFYALTFGVVAPALGWRSALWHEKAAILIQKGLFGLLTGALTPAITQRLYADKHTTHADAEAPRVIS